MIRFNKLICFRYYIQILLVGIIFAGCNTAKKTLNYKGLMPFYDLRKYMEQGPSSIKGILDANKKGTYDGDIERYTAIGLSYSKHDPFPFLKPYFASRVPRTRAFAASVAGYLGDKRYLPLLRKLEKDKTKLPDGYFNRTVAARAKKALFYLELGGFSSEEKDIFEKLVP